MKALSEELENPMNVHRWRKLEGSDPTTFEMIQKIHTLQKRLISKTEEARSCCLLFVSSPKDIFGVDPRVGVRALHQHNLDGISCSRR